MDGHFVPNLALGVPVVASLRRATRLPLEIHMMVSAPDRFLDEFAAAGADSFLVHWEGNNNLHRTVRRIKELGKRAGVVINPATPVAVLEEILQDVDQVLIMTVNPGFAHQQFIPTTLPKIRRVTWTTSAAPRNSPAKGIYYVDVGTSGGVWGLERGYCMMIGGEKEVVEHLDPIFATLAPGRGSAPRTSGREELDGTAEQGYLHCGPNGAGHFVKMVHSGIEYGLMAAYAEGLGVLRSANVGKKEHAADAETTPLRDPEHYQYDFNLRDITEVWRRGSVIASWLLDLTAARSRGYTPARQWLAHQPGSSFRRSPRP